MLDRADRIGRVAEYHAWLVRGLAVPGQGLHLDTAVERRRGKINIAERFRKADHEMQPSCGAVNLRLGQLATERADHRVAAVLVPPAH